MSWQDREYARELRGGHWRVGPVRPGGRTYDIVTIVIAINVVIYLLCLFTTPRSSMGILGSPLFQFGAMQAKLVLRGQVWRLITSDYLHWNTVHIVLNMLGLYFFGRPLLRIWGTTKFFVFYTVAGVVASLFYLALAMGGVLSPRAIAAGASGCVLGLLGAAAVMFPHAEVLVYFVLPVRIRTAAIVIGLGYAWNVYNSGPNAGGDACHIAGLVFGAWYAWRGDAWWMRSSLRRMLTGDTSARFGRGRSTTRSPNPGAWDRKMQRRTVDAAEVDRILKKVHDGGIHTLTQQEKDTLTAASDEQRQQDLRARRGW